MGPEDNDPNTSSLSSAFPHTSGSNSTMSNTASNNVSQGSQASLAIKKLEHVHFSITKMKEPLDDSNWVIWGKLIRRIFWHLCSVEPYVYGTLKRPDPVLDPGAHDIWDNNDVYAQILITNNI